MKHVAAWLAAGYLVALGAVAQPATPAAAPPVEPWLDALMQSRQRLLDPAIADPDWHIPLSPLDAASDPSGWSTDQPALLLQALQQHLAVAADGGWPQLPPGADLRAGMRDASVALLRRRLRASNDYRGEMLADPWYFEGALDAAVRRFQARHGLAVSGALDERTRAALKVSLEERIAQLAVTLERWRWLPRNPGDRFAWVDVGNTSLEVVEAGRSVLSMRVIVGHPDRPTPSLGGELRQVVFNPAWSVPRSIAVEDLLPRQAADPEFLPSRRVRVLQGQAVIDPATVNWRRLGPDNFPYQLRQDPGPGNSLGRIKIGWDNPYDIYLHDTPAKAMFALGRRTFSSGCVRLEDAAAFTTWLIAQDREWSAAETTARMDSGTTRAINLTRRVPLYIVYLTAWVDDDGTANFRRDIYGRDERLLAALRQIGR